jgi:hypothetical protein
MGYREKTGGNFAAESLENGHDSENDRFNQTRSAMPVVVSAYTAPKSSSGNKIPPSLHEVAQRRHPRAA